MAVPEITEEQRAAALGVDAVHRWSWADLYTRIAELVEPEEARQ